MPKKYCLKLPYVSSFIKDIFLKTPGSPRPSIDGYVEHVRTIATSVAQGSTAWADHVGDAINAVTFFSLNGDFDTAVSHETKIDIVGTLQRIAYHKSNGEAVTLVADWCASEWLRLYEEDNDNVDALYGLALSWLHRSQAVLYRIYELDRRSSSSSSASDSLSRSFERNRYSMDNGVMATIDEDPEIRVNTADYIEARTSLQPAAEYFDRVIAAATAQQRLNDEMLERAAEANISLGNTSSPGMNERYYRRAIHLLRQVLAAGYTLTPSLRAFLDEYGRFVD